MRHRIPLSTGLVMAIFVFFGLLLCTTWRSSGGSLAEAVAIYLAIALPGCLLILWLIRGSRRP
ncbi:hypothetical protein [Streptomyces sp. NPDC056670]|uniref:hypothetical protein n=1 Tax=unclassified Streptomyces TaxID=2593676 RepID=UPI0036A0560A